ncbi:M23 family metallopeptidase [Paenibacillus planticolens]|uniref:Peptidoglycan DD-metalloendopeptidase family protein n=1 Tax=Paenibacillus planticolens TaxID=2654976 RepID=A0ABX1ZML1_9BACL|nr:M23 family metallopeptidase [Paenibacillus planticolens]NOV01321.1 peptidoglycan DD-metalloendopeptidase family protein [Paenibacillus planticolens]
MLLKMNGAPISAGFGAIDHVHKTPHTGIDIPLAEGSTLRAIANGVVERITDYGDKSIGRGVILKLDDGREAIYGHMKGFTVKVGQHVAQGQQIGYSGNSGASTGSHLHLGLMQNGQYIDPTKYADAAIATKVKSTPWSDIKDGATAFKESLDAIKEFTGKVIHWLNPHTWYTELHDLFVSGALDTPFILGTIGGVILLMMGASWPKKWLFWGWVIFWVLRAGVFRA